MVRYLKVNMIKLYSETGTFILVARNGRFMVATPIQMVFLPRRYRQCYHTCARTPGCSGVNYKADEMAVCEFIMQDAIGSGNMRDEEGWIYYTLI